jgi:maltose O-acetyltransferase
MLHKLRNTYSIEMSVFHPRLMLAQLLMAALPPYFGGAIRSAIMRMVGFHIGPKTCIWGTPTIVGNGDIYRNLSIGCESMIGIGNYFDMAGSIRIGDRVTFGPQVMFITGSHKILGASKRAGPMVPRPICIENGVWVGARALILPGVTIGEGAVVGAGALVTKDVPPNTLVAGVPAVIKRELDPDDPIETDGSRDQVDPRSLKR